MAEVKDPDAVCITCSEVRQELQRFAREQLEPQLSMLAARLHADLCAELHRSLGSPVAERRRSGGPGASSNIAVLPVEAACEGPAPSPGFAVGGPAGQDFEATWTRPGYSPDNSIPEVDRETCVSHEEMERTTTEKPHRSLTTWGCILSDDNLATHRFCHVESEARTFSCRSIAKRIVTSVWFERVVSLAIICNAVNAGVMTEYMALSEIDETPKSFQAIELVFLIIFATEMGLRICVYHCSLFRMKTRQGTRNEGFYWNILDCLVIGLQVIELVLASFNVGVGALEGLSVIRIVRLLRLVRIIRVVKVLRFVRALRMIVYSIWRSLSLFLWSLSALALLNFVCSIYFTEFVLTRKVEGGLKDKAELDRYFGSLTTTMFSLFQAICGGVDWGTLTDVLERESGVLIVFPFFLYIVFNQIAMLNVISGIFLETAMEIARDEREDFVVCNARLVFSAADRQKNGTVNWPDFERALNHPDMQNFFEEVDIRISEAKTLFDLLDTSGDGFISADEFLSGCLRVRGPSKALDLLVLSREVSQLFERYIKKERAARSRSRSISHLQASSHLQSL